jgi:hypothetical protein
LRRRSCIAARSMASRSIAQRCACHSMLRRRRLARRWSRRSLLARRWSRRSLLARRWSRRNLLWLQRRLAHSWRRRWWRQAILRLLHWRACIVKASILWAAVQLLIDRHAPRRRRRRATAPRRRRRRPATARHSHNHGLLHRDAAGCRSNWGLRYDAQPRWWCETNVRRWCSHCVLAVHHLENSRH